MNVPVDYMWESFDFKFHRTKSLLFVWIELNMIANAFPFNSFDVSPNWIIPLQSKN